MSDDDNAPTFRDLVRGKIFKSFGKPGIVGLGLLTAVFFVWTQWESVKTWPGITSVVSYLSRETLPKADPHRISVAVVNLENDSPNREYKELIVRLLRDFEDIQVLSFDRTIPVAGPVPEER